jgi:hypothetical protein
MASQFSSTFNQYIDVMPHPTRPPKRLAPLYSQITLVGIS